MLWKELPMVKSYDKSLAMVDEADRLKLANPTLFRPLHGAVPSSALAAIGRLHKEACTMRRGLEPPVNQETEQ